MAARPTRPAATLTELQTLLDGFVDEYNHHRPHRSLPHRATPATAYNTPAQSHPRRHRTADTHDRIRHDRIDNPAPSPCASHGQLHHIGIGRTHARTHVILLVHDLHIRVINAVTGELLRDLTLDPSTDYQPPSTQRPHPKK